MIYRRMLAGFLMLSAVAQAADSPAHRALKMFQKGANFGNYLEAPRGQDWGARYDTRDLDNVKKEGFDHVRLPVAWHEYAGPGPEFRIEPAIFGKVDLLVTNALARGLGIIVNIHHFDAFTSDPAAHTEKLLALWGQIAAHYAAQPDRLAFELLNEPKDQATTEVMNPVYAQILAVIRRTNPERTVFVGPSRWNSLDEVPKLKLPADDRLIVTVHCYDPFYFTHQGAPWTSASAATVGVVYPGPPDQPLQPSPRAVQSQASVAAWFQEYNTRPAETNPCGPQAFAGRMERVAAWGRANNRPIHLGEFGAYEKADAASRARYCADMRRTAERLGFGWAVWDWKAGFRYWDGSQPAPGMRDALFGKN